MDPFLGEIRPFAFGFVPSGWALCNGALLPISSNSALYSLLGIQYGGNGTVTFGLPNLAGNIAVGVGQGPGLQNYAQGQVGGSATVSLTTPQMPAHPHSLPTTVVVTTGTPGPGVLLSGIPGKTGTKLYNDPTTQGGNSVAMAPALVAPVGGNTGHNNMAPYLVLNYCISLRGVFPIRP